MNEKTVTVRQARAARNIRGGGFLLNQGNRPHKLIFQGTIEGNGEMILEPVSPLLDKQNLLVTQRMGVVRLASASGPTPARYRLASVTDPSPVSGTGNSVPHEDQIELAFISQETQLDAALLPWSLQFGTAKEPAVNELDYLIEGNRSPIKVKIRNRSSVPVVVDIVLAGTMIDGDGGPDYGQE